jgi:ABC-type sugar transport system, periplasmic component
MRHTIRRRSLIGAAGLSVAALVLAGCAAAEEPVAGETTDSGGTEETAEVAAGCEAYADYAGNEGTEVEIYTTIIDPEASLFIESFVESDAHTGIDIVWNGDQAFEEQIAVRVEGGTAPDLAVFPQPGLLSQFEADLVAADDKTAASVDENYTADWKGYGTVNDTFYGTPLGANVKSLEWYSPKVFADNGWAIPETWDELLTLSDEIVASDFGGTTVVCRIRVWCRHWLARH